MGRSEHPYETPKLLTKVKKEKNPDTSLVDYGYEPIGKPINENKESPDEPTDKASEDIVGEVVHLQRKTSLQNNEEHPQENNFLLTLSNFFKTNKKDNAVSEASNEYNMKSDDEKMQEAMLLQLKQQEQKRLKQIQDEEEKKMKKEQDLELKMQKIRLDEEKKKEKREREEELKLQKKEKAEKIQELKQMEAEMKAERLAKLEEEKREKKER